MSKLKKVILMLLIVMVSFIYADKKSFVWTYEYMTMPEGATELEFYQTSEFNETNLWEYRVEVEHGLTPRWDFSVYQIFNQTKNTDLNWNAFQFRTRYRFGEKGEYFMDPLLYLEYNRKLDLDEPHKIESKVILGKSFSDIDLALNPVYELYFGSETEHEMGLDAGVSKSLNQNISIGLESSSRLEFEEGETESSSHFGPTISVSSGKWYFNYGTAWGLNEHSDDLRMRFIMGMLL